MTERAAGRKNTTQFVFAENSLDILRLFAAHSHLHQPLF